MRARKTPSRPPGSRYPLLSMALVLLISPDPDISAWTSSAAGSTGSDAERHQRGDLTVAPSIDSALDHEDPMGPRIRLRQASSRHCTSILAARCGVRFDTEYGGSAARAALLASCHLLSDSDPQL
ncbi:MAG: hypothetical protein DSY81_03995, partial [Bacillota bacterium]